VWIVLLLLWTNERMLDARSATASVSEMAVEDTRTQPVISGGPTRRYESRVVLIVQPLS
jgi:hypothetical protein